MKTVKNVLTTMMVGVIHFDTTGVIKVFLIISRPVIIPLHA